MNVEAAPPALSARPAAGPARGPRVVWVPHQHGAWAMLLLPILLGIAASRLSPWHAVLTVAALAGYLLSAALQGWSRARRAAAWRRPVVAYAAAFGLASLPLLVAFPALALVLAVVLPAGLLVYRGSRPGTPRDLPTSLAQVAIALTLVPAAAFVSETFEPPLVAAYTAVAGAYLVGSVLVVRSVIRERGNDAFAVVSVAFHLLGLAGAAALLPLSYAVVAVALLVRAAALPVLERRRRGGARPLRPIHVGIVEIVTSLATVLVSLAAPL